ncbi:MAG: TPM domain-containing protein [Fusobacterium sp.]|nr:TPM domain-containing protein [Fusobacterium sp.]
MKKFILLVGLLIIGLQVMAATFTFKFDGSGFISDGASVIEDTDKEKISFYLDYVKAQTSYSILVVTLDSLEGIPASKVARVVSERGVAGEKENILVFLIAPTEGKIGVEIGENLKSEISYVALKNIIQEEVSPSFKNGEYSSAITKGIYYISRAIEPSLVFVKQDSGVKFEQMSKPVQNGFSFSKEYLLAALFAVFGVLLIALKRMVKKPQRIKRGGFGNQFGL